MEFNDLIKSKVKRRLKIFIEKRKNWNGTKGPFGKSSIRERELILIEQFILEKLIIMLLKLQDLK